MKLAPLLFVRSEELRKAEWREIDLNRAEWNICEVQLRMSQIDQKRKAKVSFTGGYSAFHAAIAC